MSKGAKDFVLVWLIKPTNCPGGERREVITPWREGHPTPMAHLWDKSLQDVFFRFITKSVSNSVFNSDKGVNSRFFSKALRTSYWYGS
jgi:hypothetical protein